MPLVQSPDNLITLPGSYALCLFLERPARIQVGMLGEVDFSAGVYVYFGSAFGPGGLRARIHHHLQRQGKPRWHIDYLSSRAVPRGGWYSTAAYRLECAWSQRTLSVEGAVKPAPGFGSSDCRSGCPAHLVAFPGGFDEPSFAGVLRAALTGNDARLFARF